MQATTEIRAKSDELTNQLRTYLRDAASPSAARRAEAQEIDRELRAITRDEHDARVREAALLVRAEAIEIWRVFGCASLFEYLENVRDLQPRAARERLRVARALTTLPVMQAALEARQIVYSTARALTRVATAKTEARWLDKTRGMRPAQVEELVAGHKHGDDPDEPGTGERTVKLVLEVSEETYGAFVQARRRLADEQGERLEDDEIVATLCRRAFEDASEPSASSPYQLAIVTCRACATSVEVGSGREVPVSAATLERARCDAEDLGDLEAEVPARIAKTVTPRMRRNILVRDHYRCCVPGCRAQRNLDVHHVVFQSRHGRHNGSNLLTLCSGHHARLHEGQLQITGKAPHALRFEWRDRTAPVPHPETPSVAPVTMADLQRAAIAALAACDEVGSGNRDE
ncbi:MAG: HNH endonuclease [Deltaproteobacteria bacterium]|nr:HNH endonuclease [Deltaproteobacteria bacterium]MDQ3298920.1 HNH endonuclease [Myxococcota bacterium]